MYFDQSEIKNELKCPKCDEQYDFPRMLPCGETICETCCKKIKIKYDEFYCPLCKDNHDMPKNGSFPLNKIILNLLNKIPKKIYPGELTEKYDLKLKELKYKTNEFEMIENNAADKVDGYYSDLKNEIQLATELAIEQLNNENMIQQIEFLKKECNENLNNNYVTLNEFAKINKCLITCNII
jgi:hypothetical protein